MKRDQVTVATLELAADGGDTDQVAVSRNSRPPPHAKRQRMNQRQIARLTKRLAAIGRAAIANLVADAIDNMNAPDPIDRHLRLLWVIWRAAASELDRMT